MQRIWTRRATAAPASHCIHAAGSARTASKSIERNIRTENSINALYTSIFAAAASTDTRATGRCRRELEQNAAVKEDANEIAGERRRSLVALDYSRRSMNPSRRMIHTRSSHSPGFWEKRQMELSDMTELKAQNVIPDGEEDDFDLAIDVEDVPRWLTVDEARAKAIKRLAIKQLAIRILLRPAIAHSYLGVLKNYDTEENYPQLDLPSLIFELNATRRRIRQIKANPHVNVDDLIKYMQNPGLANARREDLERDRNIREDTNLYLNNEMPLEALCLRLSNYLLKSHDPDRAHALTMMIMTFTKTRQNDLAALIIKTILPYRFELTSTLILAIINFFRKSKDLKSFDLFLQMLEGNGYPVNMGKLSHYRKKRFYGVDISVPPVHTTNIVTYAALIRACLRFDQPERADAYLWVARAAGCMDDFAILMGYLRFYAIRKDWEKGRTTIQRTLAFIASSPEHPPKRVDRLIAMMVNLCDECGVLEVSEAIVRSAIHNGFSEDIPDRQLDIVSAVDPDFLRWKAASQDAPPPQPDVSPADQYYAFVTNVREQMDILDPPRTPHHRRLNKLMSMYAEQALPNVLEHRDMHKKDRKNKKNRKNQPKDKQDQPTPDEPSTSPEAEANRLQVNLLETTTPETTTPADQDEITTLKNEVAELKQLVLRLYQLPAAPSLQQTGTAAQRLQILKRQHAASADESSGALPLDDEQALNQQDEVSEGHLLDELRITQPRDQFYASHLPDQIHETESQNELDDSSLQRELDKFESRDKQARSGKS